MAAAPAGDRARPGPAGRRLLAWWRGRRLELSTLPPAVRALTLAAFTASGLAGFTIVALGAGWALPGGTDPYTGPEGETSVSRLLLGFTYLGLALVAAVLTAGSLEAGWRRPRLTRAAVGFVAGAVAAGCAGLTGEVAATFGGSLLPARALAWAALPLALALPLAPARLLVPRPRIAAALAAAPFLLVGLGYAIASGDQALVGGEPVSERSIVSASLVLAVTDLGVALGLLLLWGGFASVRQARDYGELGAAVLARVPWVVGILLGGKLVWLGFGYAERLPGALRGSTEAWQESIDNGPVGWVLALELVLILAVVLVRARSRGDGFERLGGPVAALSLGFASTFLVFALMLLLVEYALVLPTAAVGRWLADTAGWFVEPRVASAAVVGTVVGAAVLGFLLRRLRVHGSTALFLAVVAVWGLPRATTTAWRVVAGIDSEPPFRSVALVTLDAAVTVALAVLALLWWAGRQRAVGPGALLVALVVSTLVAHPGVFLPSGWKTGMLFYLALVYPPLWQFVLDAASLNEPTADRPARVLRAAGLAALLLVVAAVNVAVEIAAPGKTTVLADFLGQVGRYFLIVPLAALLVLAASTRRR
ncbi:MAG: hypothetical protein KJ051_12095 [Thermoleophilia bacterium]|nr:hypothetical protein [Thermoleophilia bacterium]